MTTHKNPHAVALGRRGGSRATPAQIAAARANGLLGGRPRTNTQPAAMTDAELADEIERLERRPYRAEARWAMRLFDLRQEVKRRAAQ